MPLSTKLLWHKCRALCFSCFKWLCLSNRNLELNKNSSLCLRTGSMHFSFYLIFICIIPPVPAIANDPIRLIHPPRQHEDVDMQKTSQFYQNVSKQLNLDHEHIFQGKSIRIRSIRTVWGRFAIEWFPSAIRLCGCSSPSPHSAT